MRAWVVPFDSMRPGNIGSDKDDSSKGHDLDKWDSNLLPYDPCKEAWAFECGEFLEKGEPYNHNYSSGIPDDPLTLGDACNI